MRFSPPLHSAKLIKRYKRFLADVELPNGERITLHCPNTGSMKNCCDPGSQVWFSDSQNPKRKYQYTWELVRVGNRFKACINTARANGLVKEALERGLIPELAGYDEIKTEVPYGDENSRIDFLLSGPQGRCFVEVKSVTLGEGRIGYFPDAVTTRGQKHLRELMAVKSQGDRAVLFFCVQHTGVVEVRPAEHIDADYARLLREAWNEGVEIYAWRASISDRLLELAKPLPVRFE